MKKIVCICLFTIALLFITGCRNNSIQEENSNIDEKKEKYEKITCTNINDSVADNITVDLEYKDNYIRKATYTYYIKPSASALADMLNNEFEKDFKDVNGVSNSFNNNVLVQTFDFEKIDLSLYQVAKTNYMNFVSNSIEKDFSYIRDNKVLLEAYKDIELSNYTCK